MRKLIAYLDNYDSFAGNIAATFRSLGADVKVFRSDCTLNIIAESRPDMILLGPGPSNPENSGNYLEAIARFHTEYPMFGICLGFQAMMHYFGEPVVVLNSPMHGDSTRVSHNGRGIFEGIDSPVDFARYNSLGVYSVPEGFNNLATSYDSNKRVIVMAAKHELLPIAGVQFHPESFLSNRDGQGERLMKNVLEQLVRKQ